MLEDQRESKRLSIVTLFKQKIYQKNIAMKLNTSYSTVKKVIARYLQTGTVERKKGSGRKESMSSFEKDVIMRKITENPKLSCSNLATYLYAESGKKVCKGTIRNCLISQNLRSCSSAIKPLLNQNQIFNRLKFAKLWLNKPFKYFQNIIFSDESRFRIFITMVGAKYGGRLENAMIMLMSLLLLNSGAVQ